MTSQRNWTCLKVRFGAHGFTYCVPRDQFLWFGLSWSSDAHQVVSSAPPLLQSTAESSSEEPLPSMASLKKNYYLDLALSPPSVS